MGECLITQAKSNLGKLPDSLCVEIDSGYITTIEGSVEPMDKATGQIILHCNVDDCSAELEVYPDFATSNVYDVASDSLITARYVCRLAKKES